MQVLYCDVCGVKLPELDVPGSVDAALCEKCAAARGVASSIPKQVLAEASDRRKSSSIRLKAISLQGAGTGTPGAGLPGVGPTVSVAETPRRKSSTRLRAITPDGTVRKTPIAGSSTAAAVAGAAPASSPVVPEQGAPTGTMGFYFCEKCGKRVTAADLARGQGRDKQLKGVHCAACSEGTMTVAFDAVSQAEVWKEEQARRQALRRSTSTRMPVARDDSAAPRRGRARFAEPRSYKKNSGVVWALLALLLFCGVGLLFVFGGGARRPEPTDPNPSPDTARKSLTSSPAAQKQSSGRVAQVESVPQPDAARAAQTTEPTASVTPAPPPSPDTQTPDPTAPDTPVSPPILDTQTPVPPKPVSVDDQRPETSTDNEAVFPTKVELSAEADATVRGGDNASKNFGNAATLETKDGRMNPSYDRNAYIRFDLSTLPASITTAKLRIYAVDGTPGTRSVNLVADDTWQETAITWNNAPAPSGPALSTWQPVTGHFAELDLTATVQQELAGDKKLSLIIHATTAGGKSSVASFASRETGNANHRPVLIINR